MACPAPGPTRSCQEEEALLPVENLITGNVAVACDQWLDASGDTEKYLDHSTFHDNLVLEDEDRGFVDRRQSRMLAEIWRTRQHGRDARGTIACEAARRVHKRMARVQTLRRVVYRATCA